MQRFLFETLLVGRDERTAERFLLRAVALSASTLLVLQAGWPLWKRVPGAVGTAFNAAYLLGVAALSGRHAYRNDGLVVTLAGSFLGLLGYGVVVGLHFFLCLGGCPTLAEKVFLGVLLAAGVGLPVGLVAFTAGARTRRVREGVGPPPGRERERPPG